MTRMYIFATLLSGSALLAPPPANAAIASFNGTCPGEIEVHADEGGPVFINGREITLRRFSDNYYEARDAKSGVTLSINRTPDGGTQMSYTGKNGVNGICSIASASTPQGNPARQSGNANKESADSAVAACKSALALKSGMNSVFVLPMSHVPAAGGYEVFLSLKGAQWLCTTDSRGNVNRMELR